MDNYMAITIGKHKGTPINEVPLDYLIWIAGALKSKKKWVPMYNEVIRYFISCGIRVEKEGNAFWFYFTNYCNPKEGGGERPFTQSFDKMTNSSGQTVYEIGHPQYPTFIVESENGFEITKNVFAMKYRYGGKTMVYERNPNYYFRDGQGRVLAGAFLMRKPFIPANTMEKDFSENLSIELLKQN